MKTHFTIKSFAQLSPDQLYAVMKLRQQVFIVEQNCPYLDADDKDQNSYHLMMHNEQNELIAYARIVHPGISYKEVSIGRVVSNPKYRRYGFGKMLMQKAISVIEEMYGKVPIRIGAQCYLTKFYESFDFKTEGDQYLEDGIPHTIMLKESN